MNAASAALLAAEQSVCFHCAEPLAGSTLRARIAGRDEPVCCGGCRAVAELIGQSGLADFYRYRARPAQRPDADAPAASFAAFSSPQIGARFVRRTGEICSASLLIGGLRCAACGWLIDRALMREKGVRSVRVNIATHRAQVDWKDGETDLGRVLAAIARLGYQPHPAGEDAADRLQRAERRGAIKRLGVATVGMMQVMMFMVAIYSADLTGEAMDPAMRKYFRIVSLLVTLPVFLYSGRPFLAGAFNALRARRATMDVTVGIALVLAFGASVWNTLIGRGAVYYDSVAMFIFFLTLGRFVEMSVRHRTASVTDALARQLPSTAHRIGADGELEEVATEALLPGDAVLVRTGETIPADGTITDGATRIDESLLTGESAPRARAPGDAALAGAVNERAPIRVRITEVGAATRLSHIVALLERALSEKPPLAQAADRSARWFLRMVLTGAALVCGAWLIVDPARAFAATLAVLVVACPCAFSIAMPAALAAAIATLARMGILVTHAHAVETLSAVRRVIFDKTGTLTRGRVEITGVEPRTGVSADECLALGAALERYSAHPIAKAFRERAAREPPNATDVREQRGAGVEGRIAGRCYRVGRPDFAAPGDPSALARAGGLLLADAAGVLARFTLADALREDAAAAVEDLQFLGVAAEILSGDAPEAVEATARACGIASTHARCTPEDKLERLRALQAGGECIAAIGDGINDAPLLGAANVSIAMGGGAALAHSSADAILITDSLRALPAAIGLSRKTLVIARQNLAWAAAYNFTALPLAALGYIPPWAAAIGMSFSSVAVVLNATRLHARKSWPSYSS